MTSADIEFITARVDDAVHSGDGGSVFGQWTTFCSPPDLPDDGRSTEVRMPTHF